MKAILLSLISFLTLTGCDARKQQATPKPTGNSNMIPKSHIPREQLVEMFDGMRKKTKWNIDGEMLWGYFFFDHDINKLKSIQTILEKQSYKLVSLHEAEKDRQGTGDFVLHVEKIEAHTVDSLNQRNADFDALAANHGVREYDGMDVGPVAPPAQTSASQPTR
jgi:hypothetical protein